MVCVGGRGGSRGSSRIRTLPRSEGFSVLPLAALSSLTFEYFLLAVKCRSWVTGRIPGGCVQSLDADGRLFGTQGGLPPPQTHSQKREARQMLTEEQQDTWMSLLVLEHSMTVEGMQTGH